MNKRMKEHFRQLRQNKHHNRFLQRDFYKCGEGAFRFVLLELCSPELLLKTEQVYLDKTESKYNLSLDALAPMKNRFHSEETKLKFKNRKPVSGKDHAHFGTKWSEELRSKMIKARTGKTRSPETKMKMRQTAIKRQSWLRLKQSIESQKKKIVDSTGRLFNSVTDAAKFWDVSPATVCDILKGRHLKTRKGIRFVYA